MKMYARWLCGLFLVCSLALAATENAEEVRILDVIAKKRDGGELSKREIDSFVHGYTHGKIPDYQASSLLMASFINGMSPSETAFMTDAMTRSGTVITFDDLSAPIIDKHSTGGVGDKTSLMLVPICASLGLKVPMISGRGLGHTGGTLDKLEAIPGFTVSLDITNYKRLVRVIGGCIVGQTAEFVPADKKLYALRDVSGSVESKPLIASSILSKKMAEGLDALIMDVKTGKGALIKEYDDSLELGQIMINIGKNLDKKVIVVVSDMNQPLGNYVGNSLEVIECAQLLKGECAPGQEDLKELTFALASQMLIAGGKAITETGANKLITDVIENGTAFEKFKQLIAAQGGNPKAVDDFALLPQAKRTFVLRAKEAGTVHTLDALLIAKGCSILGAGRQTMDSPIDNSVGTIISKKIGDAVQPGSILLEIHYNSEEAFNEALPYFERAYRIKEGPAAKPKMIRKIML